MAGRGDVADEDDAVDAVDWSPIAYAVSVELQSVAEDGARRTLLTLGVADDESITRQTYKRAVDYAKERAAEMVGKSWDDDGQLVDNPDAEMTILDATRDEIRTAVADAIENGDSAAELADRIEGLGAFSPERAQRIAQFEIVDANNNAHLLAFKESGVVSKKEWSTSNEVNVCEICEGNADQGPIDIDDDFESGDDAPAAHVGCICVLVAYVEESAGDDEDEEESQDGEDGEDEEAAE